MKTVALSALALALALGGAYAQSPAPTQTTLGSSVDNAASDQIGGAAKNPSPGTVGAMDLVSKGIATSADDVARQQEGRSTASEGAVTLDRQPATQAHGQSPGTVGATPGSELGRPVR